MSYLLSILLAVIFSSALGAAWYARPVFGNVWMRALGISDKQAEAMKKDAASAMAGNAVVTIVSMIGLALAIHGFVAYYPTTTPVWMIGAMIGLFIWAFFVAPSALQIVFFEKRSFSATAINLGYRLVELLGAGIILSFWA